MPYDENAPLLTGLVRDAPPRRPAKSSKQRGSILSGIQPNRFTVFEDLPLSKSMEMRAHDGKEQAKDDRINNLESAIQDLQKRTERTAIDQKTLGDRGEFCYIQLICSLTFSINNRGKLRGAQVRIDHVQQNLSFCPCSSPKLP